MAISITSLTPEIPTSPEGGSITFQVSAVESNGENLFYEWQFSNNGGASYTSSGLVGNTSSIYTTSQLTPVQNGLYWRVVITNDSGDVVNSDEDPNIGNRILVVTTLPSIVAITEPPTSVSTGVGVDTSLTVEMSLSSVDQTDPSNFTGVTIQWQRSIDDGSTWSNINDGDFDGPITNYSVTTTNPYDFGAFYGVSSTLNILSTTFDINGYQYRAQISDPQAGNSPVNVPETLFVINPIITIYSHPGEAPGDTQTTNCYKTSIANSGEAVFTIGALTTAGSGLGYSWEYSYLNADNTTYSIWSPIQDGINLYYFALKTGSALNTSTLELSKIMYFEELRIRCVVNGSSTEPSVTSNSHSILMTDVITYPTNLLDFSIGEDYYGDIANRSAFTTYPIQLVTFDTELDCSRNTGLNGIVEMVIQRQNPGETTWNDVSIVTSNTPNYGVWVSSPDINDPQITLDISYNTPPLRVDVDDTAKYRVKVESTAVYTLDANGNKVLTPIYSNEASLDVYLQAFITTQPSDNSSYINFNASFAVSVDTTSPTTVTYQWQKSSDNITWQNITSANAGTLYTGYTTDLLIITSIPAGIDLYYRVVVNAVGAISSVTSSSAKLTLTEDIFTILTNLNDFYVDQFENIEWEVTAQSLSLGTVSYQWQKSTDGGSTWSNIAGKTTNKLEVLSVSPSDNGLYRCEVTSAGGYVDYTNEVVLQVFAIAIVITKDLPSSFTILEGASQAVVFEVDATATVGNAPTFQWQQSSDNGVTWTNFGTGYLGQSSSGKTFIPNPFDKSQNNLQVRCEMQADSVPSITYSSVATLTILRRFTYFADSATKTVADGNTFTLDLNPVVTGGTPSYQWYENNSVMAGQNTSVLSLTANSGLNGNVYKCSITLLDVDQHRYSRNNVDNIVAVTSPEFTVDVTLAVSSASTSEYGKASRYTLEGVKSGAAIGTVICIPKPPNYVNSPSATTDDNNQWEIASSGDISNSSNSSSTVSSGSVFNSNKPSWVTDPNYRSPKWDQDLDRFPGYIELRGQWVKKADFPALYRVLGDAYGVTSDSFRLPNPIGKKLMGTGNVNNNSGSVSIVPLYAADGNSGGDKNVPGSIGGYYNYNESQQLPPGSPGITSLPDGTAGNPDPKTFTLGNFSTNGFGEVEGLADTTFSGSYTYQVGPLVPWIFNSVPAHSHTGVSAGFDSGYKADKNGCKGGTGFQAEISPKFYEVESAGGIIIDGPEGIAASDRGREHNHALSKSNIQPGNNFTATHGSGIGDIAASDTVTDTITLENIPGSSNTSFNLFLEPAPITMTNASKSIFDGALKFTLRNNDGLPITAPYFRLKYLIKAY